MDRKIRTVKSPYLRIISGPSAKKEHDLEVDNVILGRGLGADLCIPDKLLSRMHARIFRGEDGWYLEDLQSTNGTWLQGDKIDTAQSLPPNAIIRIGNTLLEVIVTTLEGDDEEALDETTVYHFKPMTVSEMAQDEQVDLQRLAAIYRVQKLLTQRCELPDLYQAILSIIHDTLTIERAYFLRYDKEEACYLPVAERYQGKRVSSISGEYIGRSITQYVGKTGEAVLSMDAMNDERFHSASVYGFRIRSIMCVPMVTMQPQVDASAGKQQVAGLIYVMNNDVTQCYQKEDLRLLGYIAQSASMAIENYELTARTIRAERAAALTTTAAGLSHYVKNILNGLEGSISLLRIGIKSKDLNMMEEVWAILEKNHRILQSLILDLLNLTKSDHLSFKPKPVANVMRDVYELYRDKAATAGIQLTLEMPGEDKELMAIVDARAIHRVILNLLNNAMDAVTGRHAEAGGGRIEMSVQQKQNKKQIKICVKDNGIGIPAEQVDGIFELFVSSKGMQGTGLGLAVSKKIVKAHQGTIRVQSELGKGSVFVIDLPINRTGYGQQ